MLSENLQTNNTSQPDLPVTADQTIASSRQCRYIGGYCIGKLLYKEKKKLIRSRTSTNYNDTQSKVDILKKLTVSDQEIHTTTIFPASLQEIDRRQNVRRSLVNITDDTYLLFDRLAVILHNYNKITELQPNYYETAITTLKENKSLMEQWRRLLRCGAQEVHINELFNATIHKFICSLMRKKRHDFLRKNNIKKQSALRTQLKTNSTETTNEEFMQTIMSICNMTATEVDHLCFKLNIMKRPQILDKCTRLQLFTLMNHYGLKCRKSLNKQQLIATVISSTQLLTPANYITNSVTNSEENMITTDSVDTRTLGANYVIQEEDYICPLCNGSSVLEEWLCCDKCNKWFHRQCAGIDDDQWLLLSETETQWFCVECMLRCRNNYL